MSKQRNTIKETLGLLLDANQAKVSDLAENSESEQLGRYCMLGTDLILPGKFQPRRIFNDEALQELSQSIEKDGILQPLIVRPLEKGKYEIIAGERRWRAARKVNLKELPVIIRKIDNETALAFGILENLQREDLNSIEEAYAFKRLIEEFSLTHEDISLRVGKSRVYITNSLRLLKLPDEIQDSLSKGIIQIGHAKAIASLEREKIYEAFQKIISRNLSVRQTEDLARKLNSNFNKESNFNIKNNNALESLENEISKALSLSCKIKLKGFRSGTLELKFRSLEELKNKLLKRKNSQEELT